jgi:antitoxin component HigA of HigAB toxin-antitoxin module
MRGIHGPNWRAELATEQSNLTTAARASILDFMEQWGISQSELASRMGVSSNLVGRMLSSGENLTLPRLASVAAALHARFDLGLRIRGD